jgi:hypothetical protein
MAIPKFLEDLNIISRIGDKPGSDSGLTTEQFKAKFDEGILKIQNYINERLIPGIESSVSEEGLLQQIAEVLNRKLDKAGGVMTGNIDMNGQKITNLPAPVNDGDAATKEFTEAYSEKKAMRFHDVVVPASAFSSDTTDENFPFRASIPLKDVTANMIPDVYFSFADAVSGMFAPVSAAYKGGVYIYASEQPTLGMTIPAIICRKEE